MSVNGQKLVAFNFDYNSVLAWREEAGYSAWLQFLVLPGGPVFVGKISNSGYDGELLLLQRLPSWCAGACGHFGCSGSASLLMDLRCICRIGATTITHD